VSGAVQTTGLLPTQAPVWQLSLCVQALPSLQVVPSGLLDPVAHVPVAGLQVPGSWQASDATHTTGLLPTQTPAWQLSLCVQALPSLQVVPSGFAGPAAHVPVAASQVPGSWQASDAAHTTGLFPTQTPA
jgi:hypothetical protein